MSHYLTQIMAFRPGIRHLLAAHGVIGEPNTKEGNLDENEQMPGMATVRAFDSMEDGLAFCEEQFLQIAVDYRLIPPPAEKMQLAEILRSSLSLPKVSLRLWNVMSYYHSSHYGSEWCICGSEVLVMNTIYDLFITDGHRLLCAGVALAHWQYHGIHTVTMGIFCSVV